MCDDIDNQSAQRGVTFGILDLPQHAVQANATLSQDHPVLFHHAPLLEERHEKLRKCRQF